MLPVRFFHAVLACCLAIGCGASRPPTTAVSTPAPSSSAATEASQSPDPAEPECKLYCEPPRMVPRAAPDPDYTQREIDNANSVLGSMTNDFLGCYKKRLRINPKAYGSIAVDILVGSDGHVRKVDTKGEGILGKSTMACIVHRIERGVFEPPHGGGTIHVQAPFSLQVVAVDDET